MTQASTEATEKKPITLEDVVEEETFPAEEAGKRDDAGDRIPRASVEDEDDDPRSALDNIPSPVEPPEWAMIPDGIKFPPAGCQVAYIRIPAAFCREPEKGDRQCITWALDEVDENMANKRARGEASRVLGELSKQTIRAIDGKLADWTGKDKTADPVRFFRDIGPKGRQVIRNYYVQTHNLNAEEAANFFSNHFAVVTVQRG